MTTEIEQELNLKMSHDLRKCAATMTSSQARYLVDTYYQRQDERIRAAGQVRSVEAEPHSVLDWIKDKSETLENQIRAALKYYAQGHPMGVYAMNVIGIGPVISSALLAHINMDVCQTVGSIWRFSGLDPTSQWVGAKKAKEIVAQALSEQDSHDLAVQAIASKLNLTVETFKKYMALYGEETEANMRRAASRCPWNAKLKVVCWKMGESFVKVSGNPKSVYGKLYVDRKEQETAFNEAGNYAAQAQAKLERFKIGKSTEAYQSYSKGKLPKGHLHARAKRYAVKIFLSHWFEQAWWFKHGCEPPKPFVFTQPNHTHYIEPEVPIRKEKL